MCAITSKQSNHSRAFCTSACRLHRRNNYPLPFESLTSNGVNLLIRDDRLDTFDTLSIYSDELPPRPTACVSALCLEASTSGLNFASWSAVSEPSYLIKFVVDAIRLLDLSVILRPRLVLELIFSASKHSPGSIST